MSVDPASAPYRPGLVRDAGGLYYRIGGIIEVTEGGGGGVGGVTDHGALSGLDRDDHPQYLMPSEIIAGANVVVDSTSSPGTVIISASGSTGGGGGSGGSGFGPNYINIQDYTKGAADSTDGIRAAWVAGGVGASFFYPSQPGGYKVSASLKPYERTNHIGQMNTRYWWNDMTVIPGYSGINDGISAIVANSSFTGPAVIYNNNNTTNGAGSNTPSTGVIFDNLGIFGNGTDGSIDGFDFGPASGSERGWLVKRCMVSYCSTGLAGHQWVVTVKDCMISRNGWGIAPNRGVDENSRAFDVLYRDNYVFFNNHHGLELSGSDINRQHGMVGIHSNRFERSGTKTVGNLNPFDPNINIDPYACGILIKNATAINLTGNTTDSNSGPGLDCDAVADGRVNNLALSGNIFKRDGSGNNSSTMIAGVRLKGCDSISALGNIVTYGDPNDGGAGRSAPQYGVEIDSCNFVDWHAAVQLSSTPLTRSNGYIYKTTTRPNFMVTVTDPRQPQTGILAVPDADIPPNPTEGTTYWSSTQKALRSYDAAAGVWVNAGSSGAGAGSASDVVLLTKAEYNAIPVKDGNQLYGVTSPGLRETFIGTTKVGEYITPFVGFKNTFEGIASGTAVTPANSGGASGTAFTTVVGTVVCQSAADLTTPYTRGAVATTTAGTASYVSWAHADYSSNGNIVIYVRRLTGPPANQRIFRAMSGATVISEVRWQSSGMVLLTNGTAGNGTWIASMTGATELNTIYRIEANVAGPFGTIAVYAGDSLIPLGTPVDEVGNPDPGVWDSSRFGLMHDLPQTDSLQFAYVGVSSSDKFGPAV